MLLSFPIAVVLAGLVTQERPVEKFHQIKLEGGIEATLHRGAVPGVKLMGEAEALQNIETVVKDGQLTIRPVSKGSFNFRTHSVTADITVTTLDKLEASGGCEFRGDGLSGPRCEIDVSGGVKVDLKSVACDALVVEASGGATLKLKGAAKTFEIDASGGVEIDTRALTVQSAKVEGSGGVTGVVAVVDSIDADLSGGASLKIRGNPKTRHVETSGAASVSYEK